jgi:hypothetical protein
MAIALACAPVIYPWYLLYLTPFLFSVATLPLTAWSFSVISTYVVWHLSRHGGRWVVPRSIVLVEFAVPITAIAALVWRRAAVTRTAAGHPVQPGRPPQNLAAPRQTL